MVYEISIRSACGGAINSKLYTNSKEAWEHAYENGIRVFDADMLFTKDEVLVLRHSWKDNLEQIVPLSESNYKFIDDNGTPQYLYYAQDRMDYATFINTKIFSDYTPMSCEDMLRYMAEYDDVYVACDMKDNVIDSYKYLIDQAHDIGLETVLKRIIVNFYDYDIYKKIMELYDFENVVARQHYVSPNNYYELVEFCLDNNIHVVNVSSCYMEDEGIQLLNKYGIRIYVAVADYKMDLKKYYELGADGAVTNYLIETDWNQMVGNS